MDSHLKINKNLLLIFILVFLIPIFYFFITKTIPDNKELNELDNICLQIKICNSSLNEAISNETIDFELAESTLVTNTLALENIKKNLENLSLAEDNEPIREKLIETLDLNIQLYNLTLLLIKNPQSEDFTANFSEFTKEFELLLKDYEYLKLSGLNIEFPSEANDFFNCTSNYINTLIKINREADIKTNQKSSYVLNLKSCINDLDTISEDLRPTLETIRHDNRSVDVLSKDLKLKRSTLNKIRNKTYLFNIPENGKSYYMLLTEVINSYNVYLSSLESSIASEKSSNANSNNKSISSNYVDSFSKYEDYKSVLSEFKTDLDNWGKESI